MQLEKINPFDIKVPPVRVTSSWDPDMLAMFKDSVKASGIEEPILLIKEKDEYWLVDGLHRLDEAKHLGMKTVDCVVHKGSLKEVHMKNLALNRLRGKTKASEMVAVIKELRETHKVPIEEIVKKTGFSQRYVDDMLAIGAAHREVWEALDAEEIGVGHAFQLSRITDGATQLRLLHQVRVYKVTIPDLKDIIDEAIRIKAEMEKQGTNKQTITPPRQRTATCQYCQGQFPPEQLAAVVTCQSCFGNFMGMVQQLKLEAEEERKRKEAEAAKQVQEVPTHDTPT